MTAWLTLSLVVVVFVVSVEPYKIRLVVLKKTGFLKWITRCGHCRVAGGDVIGNDRLVELHDCDDLVAAALVLNA